MVRSLYRRWFGFVGLILFGLSGAAVAEASTTIVKATSFGEGAPYIETGFSESPHYTEGESSYCYIGEARKVCSEIEAAATRSKDFAVDLCTRPRIEPGRPMVEVHFTLSDGNKGTAGLRPCMSAR